MKYFDINGIKIEANSLQEASDKLYENDPDTWNKVAAALIHLINQGKVKMGDFNNDLLEEVTMHNMNLIANFVERLKQETGYIVPERVVEKFFNA